MMDRPVSHAEIRLIPPFLNAAIRDDLKQKQELLATACRCLENEQSYRFFCNLAVLAKMAPEQKSRILENMETLGAYEPHEVAAIRRLVTSEGAEAFKGLVDQVRDIRVEQEIESMTR